MPATVISLIGAYLINPVLNVLTTHYKNKDFKKYTLLSKRILFLVSILGSIGAIICYFIGIPILEFIYRLDLSAYRLPLTIIILASTCFALSAVASSYLTILKENRRQTYIYIIVSIITTLISILFINLFGIFGAIYSFAISGVLLIISYIFLLQFKLHKMEIHNGK